MGHPLEGATVKDKAETIDQRLVRALAHPLRIQILDILSERVASPNTLSMELETGLSHVAYHTRTLDKCGCLELVDTAQRRGATEHFYKASPGAFIGNREWRTVPSSVRGAISAATLQTFLDKAIAALEAGTLDGRDDTIFRWMPLQLDPEGWKDVVAILEEATNQILAAHLRSQDRIAAGESRETISTVIGMASFETAASLQD
jgi:DNA-binding transcriptional ArsR family regulator